MFKVLVSACLMGANVRFDGRKKPLHDHLLKCWQKQDRLIPFCPEVAAGLSVPRPPAEIIGGDGKDVLNGDARVVTIEGLDLTQRFIEGARSVFRTVQVHGICVAILKQGSPACGSAYIYNGSFSGSRKTGLGVLAALLQRRGISIFDENNIDKARGVMRGLA